MSRERKPPVEILEKLNRARRAGELLSKAVGKAEEKKLNAWAKYLHGATIAPDGEEPHIGTYQLRLPDLGTQLDLILWTGSYRTQVNLGSVSSRAEVRKLVAEEEKHQRWLRDKRR